MLTNNGYLIRNYSIEDAEKIGDFDKDLELSYRYNGISSQKTFFVLSMKKELSWGLGI
jgi:hypothetical protein